MAPKKGDAKAAKDAKKAQAEKKQKVRPTASPAASLAVPTQALPADAAYGGGCCADGSAAAAGAVVSAGWLGWLSDTAVPSCVGC